MAEAHDWSALRALSAMPSISFDQYLAMPEDVARTIEISDGMIIHCESPGESHLGLQQNIVEALRNAVRKHDEGFGSCHRVRADIDVLLQWDSAESSFSFRRPDATVYRCLPQAGRGSWKKPIAEDVLIAIEVVSNHSVSADLIEKRARYARAGIPHYWIVRMARNDGPAVSVERLRLTADGLYVSEGMTIRGKSNHAIDIDDPFELQLPWEELNLDV